MDRRKFLRGAAVLTGPLVAGCTGNPGGGGNGDGDMTDTTTTTPTETPTPTSTGTTTTTVAQADTVVEMQDISFNPVRAEIGAGATVKWTNNDGFDHDVTSAQFHDKAASWDIAKTLGGGESVTHTFDSSGVFEYKCTIHGKSEMCGAILVGDVSLEKSLPCEGGGGTTTTDDGGYY